MGEVHFRTVPAAPGSPTTASFSSADIDDTRSLLNRFYYPVAVGTPAGPEGFRFEAEVIQLGPLTVGHLEFGAPVTVVAAELDAYHVSMPTAGRIHARHAGREVVASPSTGVVFGPGRPVYTMHDAYSAELNVKIERPALEHELATLLGHPVTGPIDLPPSMDLRTGAARSWRRLVQLLRRESGEQGSLIWQPLIAEQLRLSVLDGLLLTVPHRYTDELTAPAPAGPPRAIQRAIDAIQDEPERQFSVGDLARIAGLSVRSLQEGFRRHVECSPMSYLQTVRLGRAHDALRREDPARVSVATVAHRTGFAHLGRFASAYRARFGECPSETLRGAD
ncbi:AraC family transcriptional regulator [Actinoplanes friuliensis]|uniref:Putative AraC-family transcriptional regulator n=1 Tax=Actinoplanes friuliensis DSM 7358 TaxID=1246995 RepID=U5W9U4_9ACTN|nr:AraC family transcriptional regulator [Actinoplanes friuliensis]AGZ45792.1 putative AraC-family transcriptional regulator [Actinoplanes friuliensis DSM 7358]